MFRRKTDLVYSTLQQVQRRMTNQTESGQSQSASRTKSRSAFAGSASKSANVPQGQATPSLGQQAANRPATLGPFTTPKVRKGDDPGLSHLETTPEEEPLVQPMQQGYQQQQAMGILLTFPMLCVLLLLWIVSIAVAYSLGPGNNMSNNPEIGIAPGTAGTGPETIVRSNQNRVGTVLPNQKRDVIVLLSVSRDTPDARDDFQNRARKLNKVATQNPDKLKPYFGVRRTSRGGLQLIFGVKDGHTGVDKNEYADLLKIIKTGRGGFPEARWISL